MKKTSIIALFLCLVMVAFSFASCSKKNNTASTTAKPATAAGTTAEATTAAATTTAKATTPHEHTPEDHPTIDLKPTCIAQGEQQVYCAECGLPIPGTKEPIDIDPKAHKVESWVTVEPTLLNPDGGTKTGTCVLCEQPIEEKVEWKQPIVLASTMTLEERQAFNTENKVDWLDNGNDGSDDKNGVYIKIAESAQIRGEKHFYPTEEDSLGNDMLVEVSYLWNSTMDSENYKGGPLTFAHGDGYDVFHVASKLDAKDNRKVNGAACEYTYIVPTPEQIAGNSALKKPALGEYGWHRLGFRIHQEAEIAEDAVKYTYIASAYVDGTKVLEFDLTDWTTHGFASTVTGLLYTARIEEGELKYYDLGENPDSVLRTSYGLFIIEDFFGKSVSADNGAYVVFCDMTISCGQDFVQKIEQNATPEDATFTLDDKGTADDLTDDLVVPAKIWYKAVVE
ncbi:MAG: hypothetical protein J6Z13_06425 [Clostridia bacterium]|nr:hypothetical protein [Clostridia bacterium]